MIRPLTPAPFMRPVAVVDLNLTAVIDGTFLAKQYLLER